jgi:hypothetical protein
MGPWESVPATPQRERGRAAGGSKGSGIQRRVEHRSGGAGWLQASGSSDGIRAEKIFPDPAATRRRRNASPDAFLRRHAPCCTAARSRPVAEAACPNLAATAVSLSIAPCQFRPDSCDVIGFVSQFFHRRRAPSARRALSAAIPRAQKTARLARRASCRAPKRTEGSRLAVSCMTIRILRAKEPWLTAATGQERQPVPDVESLTSPRNFINMAAGALRYAGVCSLAA